MVFVHVCRADASKSRETAFREAASCWNPAGHRRSPSDSLGCEIPPAQLQYEAAAAYNRVVSSSTGSSRSGALSTSTLTVPSQPRWRSVAANRRNSRMPSLGRARRCRLSRSPHVRHAVVDRRNRAQRGVFHRHACSDVVKKLGAARYPSHGHLGGEHREHPLRADRLRAVGQLFGARHHSAFVVLDDEGPQFVAVSCRLGSTAAPSTRSALIPTAVKPAAAGAEPRSAVAKAHFPSGVRAICRGTPCRAVTVDIRRRG
jgi:hypothetical protein